jgi:hypothetical protein
MSGDFDFVVSSPATDGLVMFSDRKEFDLTAQHITLLRNMSVGWQRYPASHEGAPEIDPKRPYGNSSVAYDVADHLGLTIDNVSDPADDDVEMSDAQKAQMHAIHRQTAIALQIVLSTGSFEPGRYSCPPYSHEWTRV